MEYNWIERRRGKKGKGICNTTNMRPCVSGGLSFRRDTGFPTALNWNGIYRCIIKLHESPDTFRCATEATGYILMNILLLVSGSLCVIIHLLANIYLSFMTPLKKQFLKHCHVPAAH